MTLRFWVFGLLFAFAGCAPEAPSNNDSSPAAGQVDEGAGETETPGPSDPPGSAAPPSESPSVNGDDGGKTGLVVYPPDSLALMRLHHSATEWVDYFGRRDQQGAPDKIDTMVHHGTDGVITTLSLDENSRPVRLSSDSGYVATLRWADQSIAEMLVQSPDGEVETFPISIDAGAALNAAISSPAKPESFTRQVGLRDPSAVRIEVLVTDCGGRSRTNLDGLVVLQFNDESDTRRVPARFENGYYVYELYRPFDPELFLQHACDEATGLIHPDTVNALCHIAYELALRGKPAPFLLLSPLCTLPSDLACAVYSQAFDFPWQLGLEDVELSVRAIVNVPGCGTRSSETRYSEFQTFALSDDAVTLRVDGCPAREIHYEIKAESQWYTIRASPARWNVEGVDPSSVAHLEEIIENPSPASNRMTAPAWSFVSDAGWPDWSDPVEQVRTAHNGGEMLLQVGRTSTVGRAGYEAALYAYSLGFARTLSQIRLPTEEEIEAMGETNPWISEINRSSVQIFAANEVWISPGQVLELGAKTTPMGAECPYRLSGAVTLTSPTLGANAPFKTLCVLNRGAELSSCESQASDFSFTLSYQEAATLLKATLLWDDSKSESSWQHYLDASYAGCIPVRLAYEFEGVLAIDAVTSCSGTAFFGWNVNLRPDEQP